MVQLAYPKPQERGTGSKGWRAGQGEFHLTTVFASNEWGMRGMSGQLKRILPVLAGERG